MGGHRVRSVREGPGCRCTIGEDQCAFKREGSSWMCARTCHEKPSQGYNERTQLPDWSPDGTEHLKASSRIPTTTRQKTAYSASPLHTCWRTLWTSGRATNPEIRSRSL